MRGYDVPEIPEDKGVLNSLFLKRRVCSVVASVLVEGKTSFDEVSELDHIYYIFIVEPSYEMSPGISQINSLITIIRTL